ncbi:hypothetical protein HDU67_002010, partial [Dinochytrium kinnereticum]
MADIYAAALTGNVVHPVPIYQPSTSVSASHNPRLDSTGDDVADADDSEREALSPAAAFTAQSHRHSFSIPQPQQYSGVLGPQSTFPAHGQQQQIRQSYGNVSEVSSQQNPFPQQNQQQPRAIIPQEILGMGYQPQRFANTPSVPQFPQNRAGSSVLAGLDAQAIGSVPTVLSHAPPASITSNMVQYSSAATNLLSTSVPASNNMVVAPRGLVGPPSASGISQLGAPVFPYPSPTSTPLASPAVSTIHLPGLTPGSQGGGMDFTTRMQQQRSKADNPPNASQIHNQYQQQPQQGYMHQQSSARQVLPPFQQISQPYPQQQGQ